LSFRIADLALPGQEHQQVPRSFAQELRHRVAERLLFLVARRVLRVAAHRPVADLHGIETPGHLDHRRAVEMLREPLRVDGRRGDHHLEVRAPRQQALEVAEQEIDIEAALVRLVEDDGVVGAQLGVALRFGEQDAVGHQLHRGARADLVGEAHLVADQRSQLDLQFLGDPCGHRARGDAPRLRVADIAALAPAHVEQDLRDLGGLARARFAANDHHRMRRDRARDVLTFLGDRERRVEFDARFHARGTCGRGYRIGALT